MTVPMIPAPMTPIERDDMEVLPGMTNPMVDLGSSTVGVPFGVDQKPAGQIQGRGVGKHLVQVEQWFASSKTCSVCGTLAEAMPLSIRAWECESCGAKHDRDINAARNIRQQGILKLKAEGLSVSACGGLRKTGLFPAAACEAGSLAL